MEKDQQLPTFETDSETKKRLDDIRFLLEILIPDVEYRPLFISDRATVFDVSDETEEQIRERIELKVGKPLKMSLNEPVWRLVDLLKETIPGWPKHNKSQ